jgi:hypothetical protein
MPDNIDYDNATEMIHIGAGRIGPVSRQVWQYEVNGMCVIKHWFDYRKANPGSPSRGTDLDRTNARTWVRANTEELRLVIAVLEACVSLESAQDDLLEAVVHGPTVSVYDLEEASILPIDPSAKRVLDNDPEGKLA